MNISNTRINPLKLLYTNSKAIVTTNDKKEKRFNVEGAVRQRFPLRPCIFIIVLEPKAIGMREDS